MAEKKKNQKQNKKNVNNKQKTLKDEKQRVENAKSRGVVTMLVGLILALWFIVVFCTNMADDINIGQKALLVVSLICNFGIALTLVYYGIALFRQKNMKLSGWQLVGWLCLFFAVAAMLHLPNCGEGFSLGGLSKAFTTACFGFGGGLCGFLPAYLIHFIPSTAVQYVILGAVAILGIMLGSDMKVVDRLAAVFDNDPEKAAARKAKRDARAAKKALKKAEKAQKAEAESAPQAEAVQKTEQENKPNVDDNIVHDSKDENFLISPIITDYRGSKNTNRELGAIDLENMEEPDAIYVGRQFKPLSEMDSLDDYDAKDINEAEYFAEHGAVAEFEDEAPTDYVAERRAGAGGVSENLPDDDAGLRAEPIAPEKTAKNVVVAKSGSVKSEQPQEKAENKENLNTENPDNNKAEKTAESTKTQPVVRKVPYKLPPIALLEGGPKGAATDSRKLQDDSATLENVLASFGVKAKVVEVVCGPAIIRYELQPAPGVKVSKIVNLQDDIALALAAKGLRIEAPVPGKSVIGIEVAKPEITAVYFKDVVSSRKFRDNKSRLSIAFGIDINGNPVVGDLASMPHLLIAGATGSGKSVCMNTLICSLLYKAKPDEVKIIMIDPKKVELAGYNGLPHLARPVVTDPKKAALVLKEVVNEMDRRYTIFTACGVKNFKSYNEIADEENQLPQIVVLIDELADLMMVASRDVENHIVRLTQLARAAGIHLVIATQRPSVDVITGLIKANIPSRIAFAVSSMVDSRTILDMGGAEKLLGKGDMLYHPVGLSKPIRVQGAFLSESEIDRLVEFCSKQAGQEFLDFPADDGEEAAEAGSEQQFEDELFVDACKVIFESGQASASYLQRRFRIGYNRAARLVEDMEAMGIISSPEGKKRKVLMTEEEFTAKYLNGGEEEYPDYDDI